MPFLGLIAVVTLFVIGAEAVMPNMSQTLLQFTTLMLFTKNI